MVAVKLKKADAPTYVESFSTLPTWEVLTSRIAERFHIPRQDIAVGYLDKAEDSVTLTHNEGLHEYYKSLDRSSQIKFVVLDQRTPDCESLSVGSHLPPSLPFIQVELQSFPLGLRISICMSYPTPVSIHESATVRLRKSLAQLASSVGCSARQRLNTFRLTLGRRRRWMI